MATQRKSRPHSRSAPKKSGAPSRKKLAPSERPERPLREDLVLQACLEAYASVRHEGRMADRALDFTLRRKANLYSNERRAVAERVYGLLRRQRTVDFLLSRAHPRFDSLETSRQDVLRLAASRVLYGEPHGLVARQSALAPPDAQALSALP
ncbi:transcription antitermination factor NusB, partial [Myxococcus vastator]|uniref:transcription antitermination factor NusB n=1 Tax=Myxococcus vastator TaxID=2709664 RepID=UPI003531B54F